MTVPLIVHVSAGLAGLLTGYIALFAAKGGSLHRRSGLLFVYVMVVMALTGAVIAVWELSRPSPKSGLEATSLMGLFTAYLVVTALTAVRSPSIWSRRLDLIGLPLATAIGVGQLALGIRALTDPDSRQIVMLTTVELIFGTIALIAAASDFRIIRSVPLTGTKRIARHLWRMLLALWVAALSFFPRLSKFFPKPLGSLVAVPMLVVLVALIYWMWRIRFRKSFRGLIGVVETRTTVR
jgi:uncharacterized membrane protein